MPFALGRTHGRPVRTIQAGPCFPRNLRNSRVSRLPRKRALRRLSRVRLVSVSQRRMTASLSGAADRTMA
jgi:hypothetical protein